MLFINPTRCSFCCLARNGATYCRALRRQFSECAQRLAGARAGYTCAAFRNVDSKGTDPSCRCRPPRYRTPRSRRGQHNDVRWTSSLVPGHKSKTRAGSEFLRALLAKSCRMFTGRFRADTGWAGSGPRCRPTGTRRSRSAPRSAPWTASRATRASSSGCPLSRSCRCRWS